MKIKSLEVDGYGVWSGLRLDRLNEGLNVFFGANEAGKTTLMQFMRSMLFGFSPERRRYLPPVHGGRPGGQLDLDTDDGTYRLIRYDDQQGPGPRGAPVLSAPDGARHGAEQLQPLLGGIDESVYNNIFSVGLREIQELGTLGDTEAASFLFRLTVGLDRVSVVDAINALDASRRRLLDNDGRTGRIAELMAERERLGEQLAETDALTSQYGQLVAQRDRLDEEIGQGQQQLGQLETNVRLLETALAVRQRWQQRGAIDGQLAAMNLSTVASEYAFERFDECDARFKKLRRRARILEKRRREIGRQVSQITVNESLHRQSARVEAIGEQENWIASLRAKVAELEAEAARLNEQLDGRRRELGFEGGGTPPAIGRRDAIQLRAAARECRLRREALAEAEGRRDQASEAVRSRETELRDVLAARGVDSLSEAIDAAGNRAAQLRRRLQIDERIEQLDRHQADLDVQIRDLLGHQVLPLGSMITLLVVFVVSVVMLVAGIAAPSSVLGWLAWPLGILGGVGVLVALIATITIQRSNAQKLDAAQKQMNMVQLQMRQACDERDKLDQSLPAGSGLHDAQLDRAEKELADLEQLMPIESQRQAAQREANAAEASFRQAGDEHAKAKTRWNETLRAVGLPKGISPKQVRNLMDHREQWTVLARRSDEVQGELRLRRQELDAVTDRITQLAIEAGQQVNGANPIDMLHRLGEAIRREDSLVEQRDALRRKARGLRRKHAKLSRAVRSVRHKRFRLLEELGVRSAEELREKRELYRQAAHLRRQRDVLRAEIEAAIAGQWSEEQIAGQLKSASEHDLELQWESLEKQVESARANLNACLERRGLIKAQLAELAGDQRPARKRLEWSLADRRLSQAVDRWRVLAVTGRALAIVKDYYERERQPETLQQASVYLRQLTNGRYTRVWTPLGEDVLRVDDAGGNTLPVEVLSRGTREQLFLGLRLALVACYARRGIRVPLVLDDVLVNFDTPRAKAAAHLLRDFTREGYQLLVFTCHDHILELFQSMKVDVRRLPGRDESVFVYDEIVEEHLTGRSRDKRKQPSHKRPRHKKRKRKEKPAPVEVEVEEDDDVVDESEPLDDEIAEDELTDSTDDTVEDEQPSDEEDERDDNLVEEDDSWETKEYENPEDSFEFDDDDEEGGYGWREIEQVIDGEESDEEGADEAA